MIVVVPATIEASYFDNNDDHDEVYLTQPFQILYNAVESSHFLILPLNIYNFPIQFHIIYLSSQFFPFTQEITHHDLKKGLLETHLKYLLLFFVYSGFTGYVQQVVGDRKSDHGSNHYFDLYLQISEDNNQMIRIMTTAMNDTTKNQLFQDKQKAEQPITITNLRVASSSQQHSHQGYSHNV